MVKLVLNRKVRFIKGGGRIRKGVYLLDHFLDEFVGSFKVLWV